MSNRPDLLFILFLAFLFLLPGTNEPEARESLRKVRIVLTPFLSQAPLWIAREEGFFSRQGLEAEFVRMNRAQEALASLIQGQVDAIPGTINIALFNALAKGGQVRCVANMGYMSREGCDYLSLVMKKPPPLPGRFMDRENLRNSRIATNPVTAKGYFVERCLNTIGLTMRDVKVVDLSDVLMLEALKSGTIDGAAASEPWLTRCLQSGQVTTWMSARQVIADFPYMLLLFGPNLLTREPETGKKMMVAYLQAVRHYNQGKRERTLTLLAKHMGLDRETLMQTCWISIRNDGLIQERGLLDFQEWASSRGLLEQKVVPHQFWAGEFIEHANRVLAHEK